MASLLAFIIGEYKSEGDYGHLDQCFEGYRVVEWHEHFATPTHSTWIRPLGALYTLEAS